MPFLSKAQMRWMFANHPNMAKKWAKETSDFKHLPEKKKKQYGGSIQDYLSAQGANGSYRSRKQMFDSVFDGKYRGTASQNTKLLKMLKSGELTIPGKETPLESGVVVNKGNNTATQYKNFKPVKTRPVITGMARNQEVNTAPVEEIESNPRKLAGTPSGDYFMKPTFMPQYQNYGFNMIPLADNTGKKPQATDMYMHTTHPGRILGDSNDYESMGCINCDKDFMNDLQRDFPLGDTLRVINKPNMLRGKRKQMGGSLAAANRFAKDLANRKGLVSGDNTYVTDPNIPFLGVDGKPFVDKTPSRKVRYTLPYNVGINDIKSYQGEHWYNDPHTGDAVFVDTSVFNKFKDTNAVARLQFGGYNPFVKEEDLVEGRDYPFQPKDPTTYDFDKSGDLATYDFSKPEVPKEKKFNPMEIGIGINSANTVLSEISGRLARSRQNQYMYNQFNTLGQMNPMPSNDFQPNPFSMYAKFGGSLKKHGFRKK